MKLSLRIAPDVVLYGERQPDGSWHAWTTFHDRPDGDEWTGPTWDDVREQAVRAKGGA